MIKIDPILAVADIEASSMWYQQIFGFRKTHGGENFAVLVAENDEIVLCLHKWGDHDHPTMTDSKITPGNGLILYIKTDNLNLVRQNAEEIHSFIEEDIHENSNSLKKEFSLRDPDGYYLIVTEFHKYEG